jgi:hypothetical protein
MLSSTAPFVGDPMIFRAINSAIWSRSETGRFNHRGRCVRHWRDPVSFKNGVTVTTRFSLRLS